MTQISITQQTNSKDLTDYFNTKVDFKSFSTLKAMCASQEITPENFMWYGYKKGVQNPKMLVGLSSLRDLDRLSVFPRHPGG